ncbi:DUF4386 domain-containing protein [Nocardioides speluncae]|uniref:DUF4386 domain-containing protein n=1 Tax=Nocardioides speluncae TaxID=2670337 RepID=UPI000D69EA15|nr:DUF4386 domain-containing protein [Nocardioides speluncae]
MSSRTSGRIIGGLVLAAFVLYGGGSALVDAAGDRQAAGAVLMLLNSLGVAAIGVLAWPVLRRTDPLAATGYLATRIVEATLLAVGTVLALAHAPAAAEHLYWIAMVALGLGSLPFCQALRRARLVPAPLAVWGMAGYACLAAGGLLELLAIDVLGGGGLLFSAPGGLFEVVFGILLLVRGFPEPAAATGVPTTELAASHG